ncbi:MAG: hypothetical protein ABIX46_11680 [Burkholderiaceae bacterium]
MDKSQLVAAAITVALAGCATPQGGPPRSLESTDGDLRLLTHPLKCEVSVYVDEERYIVIDHEPVHVRDCPTAKTVVWKVNGAYKFAFDGIRVKPGGPLHPPLCQFDGPSQKQYKCEFSTGSPPGDYRYTIKLNSNAGTWSGSLDPMMINY